MNEETQPELVPSPESGPEPVFEPGLEPVLEPVLESVPVDYILVALDLSPHSEAALASAAQLAAALHLELRGLYVEDINLLRLCGLPFVVEFGSLTASPRRIEQAHLEREFRLQAAQLRKVMADVAGQRHVAWTFQVVRGGVTDQLLEASAAARMVSLGRVGRSPGKRTGSTALALAQHSQRPVVLQSRQRSVAGPFTVVYTGSDAAKGGLALGVELAAQEGSALTVLVYGNFDIEHLSQQAHAGGVEAAFARAVGLPDLLGELRSTGAVVLPTDAATWLDSIPITVIVTP